MKILLLDDHVVVRAGIRRLLACEPHVSIFEAESSQEALELCERERPDLVILDLNLAGTSGLELVSRLAEVQDSIKILVLSMHSEPVYAARALAAGAHGYLSKSASAEEFADAVRQVGKGGHYIEREIAAELAMRKRDAAPGQLTGRELEIFRLLGEGKSYTQIAAALDLSHPAVINSFSVMRDKLGAQTTEELIRLSIENWQNMTT